MDIIFAEIIRGFVNLSFTKIFNLAIIRIAIGLHLSTKIESIPRISGSIFPLIESVELDLSTQS